MVAVHAFDVLGDPVRRRLLELLASHPYLPKRIEALRMFARSSYYKSLIGQPGGEPLDAVDRQVEEIIKVF